MEETIELKVKKKEIKKHTATIHCVNNLNLLQRKISNALLYHAYDELMTNDIHIIKIGHLCKILEINSHNYDAIKNALKALISIVIEWDIFDENTKNEEWTASSILASVKIKDGECHYSYSPHMRELLYCPSVYGRINLIIQSKFRSSYGLALYENCTRYSNLPQTRWFTIDEFKKIMGVSNGEYNIFRDLKRRVIDKAIDEVNSYSEINIIPEYKLSGKKTIGIKFSIKSRDKKIKLGSKLNTDYEYHDYDEEKQTLYKILVEKFAITKFTAIDLIKEYPAHYILEKIKNIEDKIKNNTVKSNAINSIGGYLCASIKNNYLSTKSSKEVIDAIYDEIYAEKIKSEILLQNNNELAEKTKEKYAQYIDEYFDSIFSIFSQNEQHNLFENWIDFFKKSNPAYFRMNKKIITEKGLSSPMVKSLFRDFLIETRSDICPKPKSFEIFQEEQGNADILK